MGVLFLGSRLNVDVCVVLYSLGAEPTFVKKMMLDTRVCLKILACASIEVLQKRKYKTRLDTLDLLNPDPN